MSPAAGRVLGWARWAFAAIVLAAVAYALLRNWEDVAGHLRDVSAASLLLALGFAMLSPICTMLGWRVLLADLGSPLPRGPAAGMFFVGQLGKYVPGSVWSVVAQAEMGARLHIPRSRTAVTSLVSMALAALTGLVVGLPVVPVAVELPGALDALWALALVPLVLLLLHPAVLNRLVGLGLRLLRRGPLEHSISGSAVVRAFGWFLLAWMAAGAQLFVLARDVVPGADTSLLVVLSVCGFALASAVGMLSIVVPAGLGIREGVLALLLSTAMPILAATAIAVIVRFLTTIADLLWAGAGWAWARSHHLVSTRAELRAKGIGDHGESADDLEDEVEEEVTRGS